MTENGHQAGSELSAIFVGHVIDDVIDEEAKREQLSRDYDSSLEGFWVI